MLSTTTTVIQVSTLVLLCVTILPKLRVVYCNYYYIMWVELILFCGFCLVVLLLRHYLLAPKGMPPGPTGLPFLGNILVESFHEVKACRDKYGDIFKTEVLGERYVYLCNYKLIKEAFSRPEVSDRPQFSGIHFITDGIEAGVTRSNGKQWLNARRFLLHSLRDFGMGKTYLEDAIQKEAESLVDDFKNFSGTSTTFPKSINIAALNVVWEMVASKRYDLNDEEILGFVKILKGKVTVAIIFAWFPKLVKILPKYIRKNWLREDDIKDIRDESYNLTKEIIESHRESLDPNNPRDVVDEYLIAMDKKSDIATYFSEKDLVKIILDLFIAGFDTISNTLRWFILFMAKYPEVQQRVQQQIDEVVPRDTLPSYYHRAKLPLVDAMIHEVLRKSSLLAQGVQHAVQTDVYLDGYLIPKGCVVIGVAVFSHEDPQYWEHPHQFRLEHFLDKEGNFVSQKEGFLPFSIGRRNCLGETLARMELYIFTSALLQNFNFSCPEGCELDMEPGEENPTQFIPKDQKILITTRNRK